MLNRIISSYIHFSANDPISFLAAKKEKFHFTDTHTHAHAYAPLGKAVPYVTLKCFIFIFTKTLIKNCTAFLSVKSSEEANLLYNRQILLIFFSKCSFMKLLVN